MKKKFNIINDAVKVVILDSLVSIPFLGSLFRWEDPGIIDPRISESQNQRIIKAGRDFQDYPV